MTDGTPVPTSTVITELDARLQLARSERLEAQRLRAEMMTRPPRPLDVHGRPLRALPPEKFAEWWDAMRDEDR